MSRTEVRFMDGFIKSAKKHTSQMQTDLILLDTLCGIPQTGLQAMFLPASV